MKKTEKVCEYCGAVFMAEDRALRRGQGRFCNRLCANRWLNKTYIETKEGEAARRRERRRMDRLLNISKDRARNALYRAVRRGEIDKGNCVICEASKVEARHKDYSKPLDVVWLCRKHHIEVHRRGR